MEKQKILIIDSNPFTLVANREVFRKAGWEVQTLGTIGNANYWWKTYKPDVIVLGGETLRRELDEFQEIQLEDLPPVSFLLVVGYRRSDHLLQKGVFLNVEFLEKSLPPSLLVKKLRLFLKTKRRKRSDKAASA